MYILKKFNGHINKETLVQNYPLLLAIAILVQNKKLARYLDGVFIYWDLTLNIGFNHPFKWAYYFDNVDAVQSLVEFGYDPNILTSEGISSGRLCSFLHLCARTGKHKFIQAIYSAKSPSPIYGLYAEDERGFNELHHLFSSAWINIDSDEFLKTYQVLSQNGLGVYNSKSVFISSGHSRQKTKMYPFELAQECSSKKYIKMFIVMCNIDAYAAAGLMISIANSKMNNTGMYKKNFWTFWKPLLNSIFENSVRFETVYSLLLDRHMPVVPHMKNLTSYFSFTALFYTDIDS